MIHSNEVAYNLEEREEEKKKKEEKENVKVHITPLMVLCLVNEFCTKWAVNAFDSRYGIYITDRWNVPSSQYSY